MQTREIIEKKTDQLIRMVTEAFEELLQEQPHGTRIELTRVLGKSNSYLQEHKRKGKLGLSLRKILLTLTALDVDLEDFVGRVSGRGRVVSVDEAEEHDESVEDLRQLAYRVLAREERSR